MAGGVPRTVSFSPEKMIELGEEMIKWIKENPDMVHLSEWYTIEKGFIYNEWKAFIQRPEFLPYYERALKLIGLNYIKKDSLIEPNIKQRWQRVYFKDLKEEEDQDAQDKVDREMKSKTDVPPLTDIIDEQNEKMLLRAELMKAKETIKELQDKCS